MIAPVENLSGETSEPVLKTSLDERGVLTLTLNRPEKRNALNEELINALHAAFQKARDNPKVKVIVLAAEGKSFCSGIDLGELAGKIEAGDKVAFKDFIRKYVDLLHLMDHIPKKPIIGVLHGDALGLGCTLALLCDHAITDRGVKIGYPEKDFGSKPWISGLYAIRRLGIHNALDYFTSQEPAQDGVKLFDGAATLTAMPGDFTYLRDKEIDTALNYTNNFLDTYNSRKNTISLDDLKYEVPSPQKTMARQLIRKYNRNFDPSKRRFKRFVVDQFTEEMFKPEVARNIREYLSRHKSDHTTFTDEPGRIHWSSERVPRKDITPESIEGDKDKGGDRAIC